MNMLGYDNIFFPSKDGTCLPNETEHFNTMLH